MEKLNNNNSGWYLPYIQRQYVWGERYQSEEYICLLLDSLLKRYPIGGLVLWDTESRVPYREFLSDYEAGKFPKLVDEGRWEAHKFLVYDGQQRLQTLRTVLRYSFNGRVLYFDLLFDASKAKSDETGFLFRDKTAATDPRLLRMTELASRASNPGSKVELEQRLLTGIRQVASVDSATELLLRTNLQALWDIFVERDVNSIAYFSVRANDEAPVNEVFRRLNTGGVPLTAVELVLGEVKKLDPTYEEHLWQLSEEIRNFSGGIEFSSAQLLQLFYLLVKGTTRVDLSQLNDDDPRKLLLALDDKDAIVELFSGYLFGLFKINHASIVPRWLAVLPLAVYLTAMKRAGRRWRIKELSADQVSAMNTYFLLAQFCDWNTQTMVNSFGGATKEAGQKDAVIAIETMREIAVQKGRRANVSYQQFLGLRWLALKMLLPGRQYVFHENKPQLDHIFPLRLAGEDDGYRELIDVLWNLQPIPDGINNYKRARHPKEFFNSDDGNKYWNDYDFIPDSASPIWDDPTRFVQHRKELMLETLRHRYGLQLEQ
jgi:Protein of unknown function DUF262